MREIPLLTVPNQEIETVINSTAFNIRLHTINGKTYFDKWNRPDHIAITLADVYINRVLICAGVRCIPNVPIIPFRYIWEQSGAFFFSCLDASYPYYELFGATQRLFYASPDEIAEKTKTRITAG